ncbi:MAG TPA: transposase, partial [Casimicrobiaceae bacterium]
MGEDYPRTLIELERRFADDEACRQYLFALRWPQGFACSAC